MADNVTTQSTDASAVPLGTIIATEDSGGGVQVQRVKVTWGVDGTCTNPTSSAPFPVDLHWTATNTNPLSVTATSGTATIGTVLQGSAPWTVTTTPSSIATVNQGTSPWVTSVSGQMGWLSSSTSSAALPVIGQVAQATTPWNIANISNPIGWLSSSTSTSITTPPLIGSVAASTIWTVNQGTSPWVSALTSGTVTLTSGTLALGTVTLSSGTQVIGSVAPSSTWSVNLTSGTQVIGSVAPSSTWTVNLSSGTQVIGAVNQGTSPWVTSVASSTAFLGSVAVTSGTVTLTSGTLALGTVTLSSGTQTIGTVILSSGIQVIGSVRASTVWTVAAADDVSVLTSSGTALTPSYANTTTSSTLVTLVSTTSAKITTVLSAAFSVNSTSTAAAFSAQFTSSLGSTDKTYSSKFFFPTNGVSQYILPYNPIGWAQTTSSGNLSLQISAGVAGPGLGCLITYVSL